MKNRYTLGILLIVLLLLPFLYEDADSRFESWSKNLLCPVCQGETIFDSPSEYADDMRTILREQIDNSLSDDEINRIVIKADRGEVRSENDSYLQLILRNGNRYEELIASTAAEKQKYPHSRASFNEYILNIDVSEFNNIDLDEENYRSTYKMQRVNQLKHNADTLEIKFNDDKSSFSFNDSFIPNLACNTSINGE